MNKRIGVYLLFIFYILFMIFLKLYSVIDYNTLILGVTIIACLGTILPSVYKIIDDYAESKRDKKVERIEPRTDDKVLIPELESKLNELKGGGCIIDSIQILDASGWIDKRKEIFIIYH